MSKIKGGLSSEERIKQAAGGAMQKKEKNESCVICMEELDVNKNIAKTICQHSFCLTCLVKSLKNNNTCPVCRATIDDEKPSKTNALTLDEGIVLITQEIGRFNTEQHALHITSFDEPSGSLRAALRIFGLGLVTSIIGVYDEE